MAGAPSEDLLDAAGRLSGLTHHDERCRAACQAVTLAVASLVRGEPRETAADRAIELVHSRHPDEAEEIAFLMGEAGLGRPVDGPDQGYAMYAAGIGLRALTSGTDFEAALRAVVRLGGDTDTNAAVAGALVGAAVGVEGLPADWLGRLGERESIQAEAEALATLAQASGPTADST
jgi:ADP-ribosylglycohydrolase